MIRDPGTYAVADGTTFPVAWRDRGWVAPAAFDDSPATGALVAETALERLEQVTVHATWQGEPVEVQRILPNRLAWLLVRDPDLAARLELYGDPDRGWGAAAAVFELDDLEDRVVPLR